MSTKENNFLWGKYYFSDNGFQEILIGKQLRRSLAMNIVGNSGHVTSWMSTVLWAVKNGKPDISLLLEVTYILMELDWI